MKEALRQHWPEYLMEGAGLGLFMVSACMFGILLWYPASPAAQAVPDGVLRRLLMGLAMGATAAGIIYSPMGKRSGAHINPCVTLAFLCLGKIGVWDAVYYIVAQFAGGAAGVLLADPAVGYVITVPGVWGAGAAFAGEFLISFLLMMAVLVVSNTRRLNCWTGAFAGVLLVIYITLETPFSRRFGRRGGSISRRLRLPCWRPPRSTAGVVARMPCSARSCTTKTWRGASSVAVTPRRRTTPSSEIRGFVNHRKLSGRIPWPQRTTMM